MGTRQRRQREAQQRRKAILDAAMKLFWRRGYAGTTMPQIATEAELAPGTLYLYFPSKDALYVELLSQGYDLLLERLTAQVARPAAPAEQAAGLLDVFLEFAREHPGYFDIIFFVLQRERSGGWDETFPAGQVERLKVREAACKAIAAAVLQKAPGAGNLSAQQRSEVVNAVWSMLTGVVFHFGSQESFAAIAQQAKKLILVAVFGVI